MRASAFSVARRIIRVMDLVTILIIMIYPACSRADIFLVISRADVGSADSIDWSQLGPASTYAPTPHSISSFSGSVTGTLILPGQARRLDQGNGWAGNFLPGEALISSWSLTPITLTFDQPLAGVGTQIEDGYYGSFTATIQAFDAAGTLLGSFSEQGMATSAADGSAIFIGVRSDNANIQKVVLNSSGLNGFAINSVSVVAVPEPTITAFCGLALITGALCRSKRRRYVFREN